MPHEAAQESNGGLARGGATAIDISANFDNVFLKYSKTTAKKLTGGRCVRNTCVDSHTTTFRIDRRGRSYYIGLGVAPRQKFASLAGTGFMYESNVALSCA